MKTRWLIGLLVTLGVTLLVTAYQLRPAATTPQAAMTPHTTTTPTPTPATATPPVTPDQGTPVPAPSVTALPSLATPPNLEWATGSDDLAPVEEAPADSSAVLALALEFANRFARPEPGVTHEQWWPGVAELMTPQARSDYAAIDPATIPYAAVTGPASIMPTGADHSDLVTLVQVPTTAGTYVVHLRVDETRGWAVNQLTPPVRARS